MYVDIHRPWTVVRATVLLVIRGQALFLTNPGRVDARSCSALLPIPCMPLPQARSSHHRLALTDNACVRVRGACGTSAFWILSLYLPFPKPVFFPGMRGVAVYISMHDASMMAFSHV